MVFICSFFDDSYLIFFAQIKEQSSEKMKHFFLSFLFSFLTVCFTICEQRELPQLLYRKKEQFFP